MNNIYYGIDWAKGPSQTAIVIWQGGPGPWQNFLQPVMDAMALCRFNFKAAYSQAGGGGCD